MSITWKMAIDMSDVFSPYTSEFSLLSAEFQGHIQVDYQSISTEILMDGFP